MKPISAEEARKHPLTTDTLILRRVEHLVGAAVRRQLWWLLLDGEERQIPIVSPIAGLPRRPPPTSIERLAGVMEVLQAQTGAAAIMLVWERTGGASLAPAERMWASAAIEASRRSGVPLRAQLLSHSTGVQWIAPDDYL
ncbi:hypothetical protein HQQ80_12115 [Microbacteriaceae bacterium VKM Ac-2855]|nr:hypothetical protein [Microbacteriaceae bacterium VKM Ac-2855]